MVNGTKLVGIGFGNSTDRGEGQFCKRVKSLLVICLIPLSSIGRFLPVMSPMVRRGPTYPSQRPCLMAPHNDLTNSLSG